MSFSSDWLALREPFDHRSRATDLRDRFMQWLVVRPDALVVDLGGGTGSTVRALRSGADGPGRWLIVERDPALIAAGRAADPALDYLQADLCGALDELLPAETASVTASALIDLVSQSWLEALVALVARRRIPLYVALTYNGVMRWRPGDLFDARVKMLFDRHQQGDKGFGPALGPGAAPALAALLAPLGGTLLTAASDWQFARDEQEIQQALLQGYAEAARDLAAEESSEIDDWTEARRRRIHAGQSRHIVGHQDILWLPAPAVTEP